VYNGAIAREDHVPWLRRFLEKRQESWDANANWVEIDLLRGRLPSVARSRLTPSDYRILVCRSGEVKARFWPVQIRQALPVIGIPLRPQDDDVPLDLVLRQPDGSVFALSEVDEFAVDVAMLRDNPEFMAYLRHLSHEPATISLDELRKELS
jgi:hypothetical protein